jgi:hypothetical protein
VLDEEEKELKDNMVNFPGHAFKSRRKSSISEGGEATKGWEPCQHPIFSETCAGSYLEDECDANKLQTKLMIARIMHRLHLLESKISIYLHTLRASAHTLVRVSRFPISYR